jgi:hypothetical protein
VSSEFFGRRHWFSFIPHHILQICSFSTFTVYRELDSRIIASTYSPLFRLSIENNIFGIFTSVLTWGKHVPYSSK